MATKFKNKDRVALKGNAKYRGTITNTYPAKYSNADDDEMYTVQWDKDGVFLYIVDALISETEADKLYPETKKPIKEAVVDKLKSMMGLDKKDG
jgi:hypothetical protein